MQAYLIRHAHALDGDDDAARPLSRRGRAQIRALAAFLARRTDLSVREFWHSPRVRARDTAELLARRLGGGIRLRQISGLEPAADPAAVARRLQARRRPVALVGHEPHLGALAAFLVAGREAKPVVSLKKCCVLALERERGRWVIRWLTSPEMPARR